MSKGILNNPAVIDRLRRLRPMFEAMTGGNRHPAPHFRPESILQSMGNRAVFMLSFGRSGSTVFSDFLGSHPEIIKMGEVLNEDTFRSFFRSRRYILGNKRPSRIANAFYAFLLDKVRAYPHNRLLFDLKFECLHLADGNFRNPGFDFAFFDAVLASDCPVILLERRDHVARYLSLELAVHQQRFHSYQPGKQAEPLTIDIARMERVVDATEAQIAFTRQRFAGYRNFLSLTYEDMFTRDQAGNKCFASELVGQVAGMLGLGDQFDHVPRLEQLSGRWSVDPILNRTDIESWKAMRNRKARPYDDLT